jgi:DNA polymerase (family 10)
MQNREIAAVFDEIADILEITEDDFFRVRAYRNAARTIRDHPAALVELTSEQMQEIPGIGADLAGKIATLIAAGELPLHRELMKKIPPGLLELRRLPSLGPKRIKLLHERLKVRDAASLKHAIESGAIRTVRGFGPKLEAQLLKALNRAEPEAPRRWPYAEAAQHAEELLAHMRKCRALEKVEVAGSFRRRRETIGDLDLLAVSRDPARVMEQMRSFPGVRDVLGSGETKTTVVLRAGIQVDLRVVPRKSYGAALVYFTGSKAHNVHLRRIAQTRGLLLNEYGLFRGEEIIAGATEETIYRALDLKWMEPELREDRGEIEAAGDSGLPHLIARGDLRGDLHSHSTWTDGRASIAEMARAARERGLEYVAVTDHSRRLAMAHGLDPVRIRDQWREIDAVAKRLKGITLLKGIEVDILEDGSLDLPDETLAELDWVVASVHYKLDQDERAMTQRMITAMRNPYVDVIGHPSGRLIDRREPSSFDLAEVLKVAREEGCALEVNSQPERLDLIDTACIAARRAGVKLVISSDSHHPSEFAFLDYGVNQARRGWVEADDVLNTRPLAKLRQR